MICKTNTVPAIAVVLSLLVACAAEAQMPRTAEEYYSRGVHHYFSGCNSCAEDALTMAIAFAPDDPRPYYFRALSLLRMGREFDARGDMQLGAELEASRPGTYAVGQALERVQGGHRLKLEHYRRQARLAHMTQRHILSETQRDQLQRRDQGVERRRVLVPLDRLSDDVAAGDFPPESDPQPPQPIGPQRPDLGFLEAAPSEDPAGEAPAEAEVNPFRDDPLPQGAPDPSAPAEGPEDAADDDAPDAFEASPFEGSPFDGEGDENPFGAFD